jgi:hypothetical protein
LTRMVRSRKEWRCEQCGFAHLTFEGTCRECGAIGTLLEVVLVPTKPRFGGTDAARKLRRRAKDSERGIARRMVAVDGVDPAFSKIASSTGRIGHISGIRVDAVSLHYVTENKNRKIPSWMALAWTLINQRAFDFNKHALLHIEAPNVPRDVQLNGVRLKIDTMAIITQTRHEELIRAEQMLKELLTRQDK